MDILCINHTNIISRK